MPNGDDQLGPPDRWRSISYVCGVCHDVYTERLKWRMCRWTDELMPPHWREGELEEHAKVLVCGHCCVAGRLKIDKVEDTDP